MNCIFFILCLLALLANLLVTTLLSCSGVGVSLPSNNFWSSSEYNSNNAWNVNTNNGNVNNNNKNNNKYVRAFLCVS